MKRRILLVEDDRTLRQTLAYNLEREGYAVTSAVDGEQALAAGRAGGHDLIILDLMLPALSGLEVLRILRSEGLTIPVIILSAKGAELDRVVGLKVGADDYVAKPFSRPELLARVEAVLRRPPPATDEGAGGRRVLEAGPLRVDPARHIAAVNGREIELTTRQFQLLAHFAANPERIFSRDQLLSRVWGPDFEGGERTVDVHVSWLRTRLRERTGHDFFRTVRGVGYAFTPPAS